MRVQKSKTQRFFQVTVVLKSNFSEETCSSSVFQELFSKGCVSRGVTAWFQCECARGRVLAARCPTGCLARETGQVGRVLRGSCLRRGASAAGHRAAARSVLSCQRVLPCTRVLAGHPQPVLSVSLFLHMHLHLTGWALCKFPP